jgi:hypothetical protein
MQKVYEVDFEHEDGFTTTSLVAGDDENHARVFAERCAKRGYSVNDVRLVERRETCHYCGMPSVGRNYFGVPVCGGCGG